MKVKELNGNWKTIRFSDRVIIKNDLKYMSKEQVEALGNITAKQGSNKKDYIAI